jgi:hypothetical protein
MKKYLFTVLVVISLLTMFTGTVGAAPQMSVSFIEAFWTGYGVNFKFKVSENLGDGWLVATVSWDGGKVDMTCVQEEDIVTCTGPKTVADKNIVVSFQGMTFATYVKSHPFCYSIYDWNFPSPYTNWTNYGGYCQEVPANYGDSIIWNNPVFGPSGYEFLPESPACLDFVNEGAYYYSCPNEPL